MENIVQNLIVKLTRKIEKVIKIDEISEKTLRKALRKLAIAINPQDDSIYVEVNELMKELKLRKLRYL